MKYRATLYGVVQRPSGDIVATIIWQSVEAIQYFGWWHQEAVIGRVQPEEQVKELERLYNA